MTSRRVLGLVAVASTAGCPGGDGGPAPGDTETGGTTPGGSTTDPLTTELDTTLDTGSDTNSDTGAVDTGPANPCADQYPLPFPQSGVFDSVIEPDPSMGYSVLVEEVCPTQANDYQLEDFTVYVYRPAVPGDSAWPSSRLPSAIFISGIGINVLSDGEQTYDYLFEALSENGFVVVAIQAPNILWDQERRLGALLCGITWLRDVGGFGWPEAANERLNCDLTVMGHSRGAMAAQNLVARVDFTSPDLQLAAGVSIATAADLSLGREGTLIDVVPASKAVPFLLLQGANDEDPTGDSVLAADRFVPEDPPSDLAPTDEVHLWAYDTPHRTWGGRTEADQLDDYEPRQIAKAEAIATAYIPRFLRWQVFGENELRPWFVDPARYDSTALDFPPEVGIGVNLLTYWGYLTPSFFDLGFRPVILTGLSMGVADVEADRLQIDTMFRPGDPVPCGAPGQATILSPSTLGQPVVTQGFGDDDVCISPAADLSTLSKHETFAMLLEWGAVAADSSIQWEVNADLSAYSHLSLKLGKPRRLFTGSEDTTLSVLIDLETESATGAVLYNRIISQDDYWDGVFGDNPPAVDFMHTVRIPLADFCDQGADVASVVAVGLRVPPGQPTADALLVDSIEFTRHPEDQSGSCPSDQSL